MFRTIFTKSLRDYRWAILGWGLGLGLYVFLNYASYKQLFGGASGAATIEQLGKDLPFFGDPIALNTPGGYASYRIMGLVPVLVAIWTVLAGARMTRGEEERGALDVLLSTPQSRLGLMGQKALALAAATGLISVLISVWIVIGMASAQVTVDPATALLAGLNVGLTAFVFGTLALLLAQFMGRGTAAGWAGGLMGFFYVLDGAGRVAKISGGYRYISPFYYYQLSKPLVSTYGTNWGALAVLAALSVTGFALAAPLFAVRDIGRTVQADVLGGRRARRVDSARASEQSLASATRDVFVRGVGVQALRRQGPATFWWAVALAIMSGVFVNVAKVAEKGVAQSVESTPLVKELFSGVDIGTNAGFLALAIFFYVPVVVAVFAGLMANRWATDLDNGRMELMLSTPVPRWRLVLERYSAVLLAAVAAPLGIWLGIMIFAQASNFSLDAGRVAEACLGMLPLELITASLVYALAGLMPPGAVIGVMSGFLGVSFLADALKALLNLPGWVLNLSIFHQYGTPILDGLNWGSFAWMLVIAAVLLAVGVWQFAVRDVDRGAVS